MTGYRVMLDIGEDAEKDFWKGAFRFPCVSHNIYFQQVENGIFVVAVYPQRRLPLLLRQRKPSHSARYRESMST
ncbi:hypothetical protein AAGQ96_01080 [Pantoea sp. MBD-2R]|uniref:hypothetical protein n=1 Tax=Pantoea sp. MBD-2R TaxID=3141540 RepID=UPI003182C610